MEHPDAMLADWLTGRQPIPDDVDTPMMRAVRQAARDGEQVVSYPGAPPNPSPR